MNSVPRRRVSWTGRIRLGLLGLMLLLAGLPARGALKADETVEFYPALALPAKEGWHVDLRGIIYEPETHHQQAKFIGRLLGIDVDVLKTNERSLFLDRMSPFLVDHERGKKLVFTINGASVRGGESAPNGHFAMQFDLPEQAVTWATRDGWLSLTGAVQTSRGIREVPIRVRLSATNGWSVISDIDDTIKISHVLDTRALIRATFCQQFQAVPGMADLYRRWAAAGAEFHYVSASPWQLCPSLTEFIATNRFPEGTIQLKQFRIKDSSIWQMFGSQNRYKMGEIERLLGRLPGRRFVFVGDSGEQDPEIYGEIARRHTNQVHHIYIRNVTQEGPGSARYEGSFRGVNAGLWTIFSDCDELTNRPTPVFPP